MRSSGLRAVRAARPIWAIATLIAVLGTAGPAKADRDELRRFLDVCHWEPVSRTHRYTYPTSYMRRAIAAVQEELSALEDRMSSDLDDERMADLESDIGRARSALHCWERRLREAELNPRPLPPREIIDAGDTDIAGDPVAGAPGTDGVPAFGSVEYCREEFDRRMTGLMREFARMESTAALYRDALDQGQTGRAELVLDILQRNVSDAYDAERLLKEPLGGCEENWPDDTVPPVREFVANLSIPELRNAPDSTPETDVAGPDDAFPYLPPDFGLDQEPTDTGPDGPFDTTIGTRWRLDTRLNLSGRDLTGFNFGQVGFPTATGETVFDEGSPTGFGFDGEIGLFATFPEPDGHDGVRPFAGVFGTIVYAEDDIDIVRDTAGGPALLGVSVDGVNAFQFNENAILNTDIEFWRAGGGVELGAEFDVGHDWTLTPSVRGSFSYEETDIDSNIDSDFAGGRFENTLGQLLRQRDLEMELRFGAQLRVAPDWLVSGTAGTGFVFRDSELESSDCFDGNRFVGGCDGAGGLSQINTDRSEIGPTVSLAGALMFLYACDPENFVSNCMQLGFNAFFQNRPRTVIRNPTAQGETTSLTSERGSAFGGGFQITVPLGY